MPGSDLVSFSEPPIYVLSWWWWCNLWLWLLVRRAGCGGGTVAHWDNYKYIKIDPGKSDLIRTIHGIQTKKQNKTVNFFWTSDITPQAMSEGEAGERVYIFCPNLETWNILWETVKVRLSLPWSINSNTCPTWREGAPGQLPDHQGGIVCMGFWASISFDFSPLWPVGSKIIKLFILSPIFFSITKLPFLEKYSPPGASFQISNAIVARGHITPPLLTYIRGGGLSMCPPSESPSPLTNVNVSDHSLLLIIMR